MKIGTKSVLFGAHCFFLHPIFVFIAWWRLYGFPYDPRLWVAFIVHDLGYWGKPNMDGEEGELHPYFGAKIMRVFGHGWFEFTLYHSRFLAKKNGAHFSKLCVADKYSYCLTPAWLYIPMASWTGEINEYMKLADVKEGSKYQTMKIPTGSKLLWHEGVKDYLKKWAIEHKDLRKDTWTPDHKTAINTNGVWK